MNEASGIPLNCGSFTGINIPTYNFQKPVIGEGKFILSTIPVQRIISSGTVSASSFIDVDLISVSGSTTITDHVTIVNQSTTTFYPTDIISVNSGIILGTQDSIASGVSTGSTVLIARHDDTIFDTQTVLVSGSVGASSTLFQSYKTNSLGKHVSDAIDNRLLNKTASSTTIDIFSTRNDNTNTYVRNTQCWASGLDLTCVSPWNSTGGSQRCGVLISPRHIIFAAHFQINNNATIRFVDSNNNVITRTMVNKLTHPNYYNPTALFPDITVGVLDQDVPNSIGFAKILPLNWYNYLPTLTIENDNIAGGFTIPCLYSDQQKKALVTELRSLILPPEFTLPPPGSIPWPESGRFTNTLFRTPTITSREAFFESIITGDSGSPAFLIINNELVLITVWTYGGAGGGTSLLYFKNDINDIMNTLGGGYNLTEINLSSFTDYS
jgi:hypothetical protein